MKPMTYEEEVLHRKAGKLIESAERIIAGPVGENTENTKDFTESFFNKLKTADDKFEGFPIKELVEGWQFDFFKDMLHLVRALTIRARNRRYLEKKREDQND